MTSATSNRSLEPVLRSTRKISGRRATIARRLHESLQSMAQLTLHARAHLPDHGSDRDSSAGPRSGFGHTARVVYCASRTLPDHPELNSTLIDDTLELWQSVNIGVAVATDWGLAVPVIRETQDLTLGEIAESIRTMADKARSSDLKAEDVLAGTFTVTSLGAHRVEWFTPIVNPPQVAILGIGRVSDGGLPISLTFDHRAVDGEPAAAFLEDLLVALETRDERSIAPKDSSTRPAEGGFAEEALDG